MKNLHIICGDSAGATLKNAFVENNLKDKNSVHVFFDALNIGNLFSELSKIGLQNRANYINQCYFNFPNYTQEFLAFFDFPFHLYHKITIWHTDNASDKLMLYLFSWFIRETKLDIEINEIYINQDSFLRLYPYEMCTLGLLNTDKIKSHINDNKPLSQKLILSYAQLWDGWKTSASTLRIWKNKKVMHVPENYFDEIILSFCSKELTVAARVIGQCLGNINYPIGDTFFNNRIQNLVKQGDLIANNTDLSNMRNYSVKLATN